MFQSDLLQQTLNIHFASWKHAAAPDEHVGLTQPLSRIISSQSRYIIVIFGGRTTHYFPLVFNLIYMWAHGCTEQDHVRTVDQHHHRNGCKHPPRLTDTGFTAVSHISFISRLRDVTGAAASCNWTQRHKHQLSDSCCSGLELKSLQ